MTWRTCRAGSVSQQTATMHGAAMHGARHQSALAGCGGHRVLHGETSPQARGAGNAMELQPLRVTHAGTVLWLTTAAFFVKNVWDDVRFVAPRRSSSALTCPLGCRGGVAAEGCMQRGACGCCSCIHGLHAEALCRGAEPLTELSDDALGSVLLTLATVDGSVRLNVIASPPCVMLVDALRPGPCSLS